MQTHYTQGSDPRRPPQSASCSDTFPGRDSGQEEAQLGQEDLGNPGPHMSVPRCPLHATGQRQCCPKLGTSELQAASFLQCPGHLALSTCIPAATADTLAKSVFNYAGRTPL